MTRRHHLVAIALVGVIAAMAAATASAGNAAKAGGTINIDLRNDLDYTDPALSYYAPGWELEYATQLKLVNYPDSAGPRSSQLTPEAATGFPKISSSGKVYDFTVNANFTKFSDGKSVTAANVAAWPGSASTPLPDMTFQNATLF